MSDRSFSISFKYTMWCLSSEMSDRSFSISLTCYILHVVYVNDVVIIGDDSGGIAQLKMFLQQTFHIKDLGKPRYFLGIEVARSWTGINLSQRKYVFYLLEETSLLGSYLVDSPMDLNQKLLKD
jgi:hypothetical protein